MQGIEIVEDEAVLTYTIPMPQAVLTSESASVLDFVQSGPPNLDVNGAEKSGHCGGVMMAHPYYARNSSEDCNSHDPYPSTCWLVQRLTSRRLASSRWLTPLDRSSRMYSRCCPVRTGRRPGKRPSVRAFA